MTEQELSQLIPLKIEKAAIERKIEELKAMATNISPNMSGSSFSGQISDKTGTYGAELADARTELEQQNRKIIREMNRIMRYISKIEDSYIRVILWHRFVECMKWEDVAAALGGGNSAGSVRMACKRYLRDHP